MNTGKRVLLTIGVFAALLPFGVVAPQAAVTDTASTPGAASGTAIDWAIDIAVQNRVTAEKLSAADAQIAREQLQFQFLSLTAAEQRQIASAALAVGGPEGALRAVYMVKSAVVASAREALTQVQSEQRKGQAMLSQNLQPKLGPSGPDLVFVATASLCRVADTRLFLNGNWPGPVAALTGRQIWAYSAVGSYAWNIDQGGTGNSGSGNCVGSEFFGTPPVSVVATVAVVNTASTGSMRAWNGGPTLTVGGILGWNAGDVLSNTTVIPLNRSIAAYPGSGAYKRDFAVFNNSPTPVDVIVDVVGYFVYNAATALDCTVVPDLTGTSIPAFGSVFINAPGCPTGYTAMTARPTAAFYGMFLGTLWPTACRVGNFTAGALTAFCDANCCRVPGQ